MGSGSGFGGGGGEIAGGISFGSSAFGGPTPQTNAINSPDVATALDARI
jgi:hypothetical protein